MSELQISLLAIGALVIVAVFGYNKWQERKLARGADASFRSRHEDVLLKRPVKPLLPDEDTGRADDQLRRGANTDAADSVASRIEPVMHSAPPAASPPVAVPETAASELDYVVTIDFTDPVPGDLITSTSELAALPHARWEGFAQVAQLWQSIDPGETYQQVRAVMQMVSRQGMVQQRDLALFNTAALDTAQRLGGSVSATGADEAFAAARALDAFCGDVDVQIAIHLVSRDGTPFAGTKLRALAEAAGMSLGPADRQFSLVDDDGLTVYSMVNKEAQVFQAEAMREISTRGISLLLDVPRAPGGTASFRAMVMLAQRMSTTLNAAIVDDNGNPLGDRAFDAIATQLAALHRTMEERGIAAGSPSALRLFS
jgi:FtsZ-interacting cell division protein ZipA